MSGSGSPEPFGGPGGRAVVLGGGGLTGIAWLGGVLDELPPVLATADRVVGTSAGAVLAARLLGGGDSSTLGGLVPYLSNERLRPSAAASLLAAQVWPSRRHALQWLGRRAVRPVSRVARFTARPGSRPLSEAAFVDLVGRAIGAATWPRALIVVAVDALAGRPAYFTARSQVPLASAVAASCAMPGVLPAVRIERRWFLDGGLRSPANADLATGCDRVLVLAPQWRSARAIRRPEHQADRLRAYGAEVVLLQSPNRERQSLSADALPAAREAGRRQGRAIAAEVGRLWA